MEESCASQHKREYFESVQGVRGFAASSVFLLHLQQMAIHGKFFPALSPSLDVAWSTLGQGVGLFFMVSGFVIPPSLARHNNLRRFFIDRLLRIMPLFVIIHLIVFIIGPIVGYKWFDGIGAVQYVRLFVTNITFTALPLGLPLLQQNSWTLTYEVAFYILIAIAWRSFQTSSFIFLAITAFVGIFSISAYPVCIFFLIGLLFSVIRLPELRLNPVFELIVVAACLSAYYYFGEFKNIFAAAIPGAVLFSFVIQRTSQTSRFLSCGPLRFLGMISYSFYLIHPLAVFPLQVLGSRLIRSGFSEGNIFLWYVPLAIVSTIGASWLSYHLVEVKLRNLINIRVRRSDLLPA